MEYLRNGVGGMIIKPNEARRKLDMEDAEGGDVLLTGEIKHHEILLANELGISIVDAGHFKTEDIVISPLCRKLSERFGNTGFTKSEVCNDKIKYI